MGALECQGSGNDFMLTNRAEQEKNSQPGSGQMKSVTGGERW